MKHDEKGEEKEKKGRKKIENGKENGEGRERERVVHPKCHEHDSSLT